MTQLSSTASAILEHLRRSATVRPLLASVRKELWIAGTEIPLGEFWSAVDELAAENLIRTSRVEGIGRVASAENPHNIAISA